MPKHTNAKPELGSVRQDLFVREYLIDFNATQAAIRAGYGKRVANKTGSDLLANPDIQAKIRELVNKRAEKAGISAERVLNELARIGFSDIRNAVKWGYRLLEGVEPDEHGNLQGENFVELVDSDKIDDDTARAIAEVSKSDRGVVKVKLYDKRAALVDLGKHIGLFAKREDAKKHPPAKAVIIPAKRPTEQVSAEHGKQDEQNKAQPAGTVLPMLRNG